MEERFWHLASLVIYGEATPAEEEELEVLAASEPQYAARYTLLSELLPRVGEASDCQRQAMYDRHLQRMGNRLTDRPLIFPDEGVVAQEPGKDKRNRYRNILWGISIAASMVIFIPVSVKFFSSQPPADGSGNTVNTCRGSKSKIVLPDGTVVWLKADSKLTYNGDFNKERREVNLVGEAYFDVAKNKAKPFVIHTPVIDLKVLGTAFNVRSYNDDRETETVLVHGSLEVMLKNSGTDNKILLKPGEKLVVKNEAVTDNVVKVALPQHVVDKPLAVLGKMDYHGKDSAEINDYWTGKKLYFENQSLEEIAVDIGRWYNTQVIIRDPSLLNMRLTGSFQNETLEEVMRSLRLAGGFSYELNGHEIIIGP